MAALSCEALQADVTSFEQEALDSRPHKFEVQAAGDLAALLARLAAPGACRLSAAELSAD